MNNECEFDSHSCSSSDCYIVEPCGKLASIKHNLIRQGCVEVHLEPGKKLEQEVLDESKKQGVN